MTNHFLSLVLLASLCTTQLLAQKRHPRFDASAASKTLPCVSSLDQCPLEGCGGGDKLLNAKKNILDLPTAEFQVIAFDDLRHLEEERPTTWVEGQSREEVEKMGEGTAVMLAGFLLGAHSGSAESCNCELSGEPNNDYHLNVVEHDADPMTNSVVVEMTPKMRATTPQWTLQRIKTLPKGRNNHPFVRISGYLLFDSEHVTHSGGERMTIWEVHPVTKLEYCVAANCDPELDAGWTDITKATTTAGRSHPAPKAVTP